MNTIGILIKETSQLILFIIFMGLILKLFFRRTLIGKIIAVVFMDAWLFIKLSFRITKRTGIIMYKTSKVIYEYLNNKLDDKSSKTRRTKKKVVNGNAIIDFESAKKLRHKWYK